MLLVEESFENIQDIADYVYLMENGRIVHEGTVAALRERRAAPVRLSGSLGGRR